MAAHNVCGLDRLGRRVFRYQRLKIRIGAITACVAVGIWVGIEGYRHSGLYGTVIWGVIWGAFVLVSIPLLIGGASDIVVDHHGIYRELYGMRWKSIRWDNIKKMDSFNVLDRSQGARWVTAYNIFPIVKANIRLLPSGKITFLSTVQGMSELLQIINNAASEYCIPLRVKKDGKMTTVDHLEP